jgi:hypothetical protein
MNELLIYGDTPDEPEEPDSAGVPKEHEEGASDVTTRVVKLLDMVEDGLETLDGALRVFIVPLRFLMNEALVYERSKENDNSDTNR